MQTALFLVLALSFHVYGQQHASVESDYETYISAIPAVCRPDTADVRDLLPDKGVFVAIKHAIMRSPYGRRNQTFLMGAGRGTSGTTTGHKWCIEQFHQQRSNVHYQIIDPKPMRANQAYGFVEWHLLELKRRRPGQGHGAGAVHAPPSITSPIYQKELAKKLGNHFGKLVKMDPPLGCLADIPWVNFFTEIFYATCPHVKVFLFRRDPTDWALSRSRNHANSATEFICPFYKDMNHDPFSITQCSFLPAMQKAQPKRGEALNVGDLSIEDLAAQYRKYNRYVNSIVPDKMLLEIKLFSSRYYPKTIKQTNWSHANANILKQFLND